MKKLLFILLLSPFLSTAQITADAGIDQSFKLPRNYAWIYGGAPYSKKGSGGPITLWQWSQLSGPTMALRSKYPNGYLMATYSDSAQYVTGLAQGTYVFRLLVTDSAGNTDADTMQIVVQSPCEWNNTPTSYTLTDVNYSLRFNAQTQTGWKPGDTVRVQIKDPDATLIIGGLEGCPGQPITFIPGYSDSAVLRAMHFGNNGYGVGNNKVAYIKISGVSSVTPYGFRVRQVAADNFDHVEIDSVQIVNSFQTAIHTGGYENQADPADNDRSRVFPARITTGLYIHDNLINGTYQEAMYTGPSSANNNGWAAPLHIYPFAPGDSTYIYNNIVLNTGRDGIQVTDRGYTEVYNNYVSNPGNNNEYGQTSALNIGTGTWGRFYHNFLDSMRSVVGFTNGNDTIRYYDNYIRHFSFGDTITQSPTYTSGIYGDGSITQPQATRPQVWYITKNFIRNDFPLVRAMFLNDYENKNGKLVVDSNQLYVPRHNGSALYGAQTGGQIYIGRMAIADTAYNRLVGPITFPSLPMTRMAGPGLISFQQQQIITDPGRAIRVRIKGIKIKP